MRQQTVDSAPVDLGVVARVLGLEALAIRVIAAFGDAGIDVLLLKGPVTNRWLYQDAVSRAFGDIDLLVAPSRETTAKTVLAGLGFIDHHAHVLGIFRPDYESAWVSEQGNVDLHTRLAGIPIASADDAWHRLRGSAEDFTLHGVTVRSLDVTARITLLGLHAARSADDRQALRDLEFGLERFTDDEWQAAADLAHDLEAGACFALGLRRAPAGVALLGRLVLIPELSVEAALLARDASQQALVIASAFAPGGARWAAVARWLRTDVQGDIPLQTRIGVLGRTPGALIMAFLAHRQVSRHRRRYERGASR